MKKLLFSGVSLFAIIICWGITVNAQKARCTGDQLSLVEGDGDADMGGKRYGVFEFTNTSSKRCVMSGYPTFAALNRAGKVIASVPIQYTNNFPNGQLDKKAHPKLVTLDAGKKAQFRIYYNDGMALDHKRPFPKVSKVRITAPKDKKSFVLKSGFTTCCGVMVGSIEAYVPQ